MVNFNGNIVSPQEMNFEYNHRLVQYGDGLFETMKYANGQIHFFEEHYFRLMASMRILRMDIPMSFTPEYLRDQVLETIGANHWEKQAIRVRLNVWRNGSGKYTPINAEIGFSVTCELLDLVDYELNKEGLKLELFKDFEKPKGLFSNLKTTNALLYTVAGIYASENQVDDVFLINTDKHILESTNSNVYIIKGNELITPPLASGCTRGVMRVQILKLAATLGLTVKEESFSPFELQRADECWLSNSVHGIRWVGTYRQKTFKNEKALALSLELNKLLIQDGI